MNKTDERGTGEFFLNYYNYYSFVIIYFYKKDFPHSSPFLFFTLINFSKSFGISSI